MPQVPHIVEPDTVNFSGQPSSFGINVFSGPWEFEGYRYVAATRVNQTTFESNIAIYRTADGIHFTPLNATGAPPTTLDWCPFKPANENKIYCGYITPVITTGLSPFSNTYNLPPAFPPLNASGWVFSSITSGSLPPGLSAGSFMPYSFVVSGTPTTPGLYNATLTFFGTPGGSITDRMDFTIYINITTTTTIGGFLSFVVFDMTTNTFGTANVSNISISSVIGGNARPILTKLSTGALGFLYSNYDTPSNSDLINWVEYNSGWGSPVLFSSQVRGLGISQQYWAMATDASNTTWVLWDHNSSGSNYSVSSISSSGTIGSPTDVITGSNVLVGATTSPGVYLPLSSSLIPDTVVFVAPCRTLTALKLVLVSSATSSPSISAITVDGSVPAGSNTWGHASFWTQGTEYNTSLQYYPSPFGSDEQFWQYQSSSISLWPAHTVLWDYSTAPPPDMPTFEVGTPFQLVSLSFGALGTLLSFFSSTCAEQYYWESAPAPPPPPPPSGGGSHQICTTGGGSIPNSLQIVRTYRLETEPLPADQVFFCPWSDLGYPFEKTARNLRLDIDTGNVACSIVAQTDANTVQTFTVTSNSNERIRILPFTPNLTGRLWRLSLTPGVGGKCQLFSAGIDFVAEPGAVDFVDTYEQSFGYPGWKFIKQCWITYQSFQAITITFMVENRVIFYQVALPAHANRDEARFYLPAINAGVLNKSRKYSVQISSSGTFRLYADSAFEWFGVGTDQRGSFSLASLTPEMQQSVAQPLLGQWPKPIATEPSASSHPG